MAGKTSLFLALVAAAFAGCATGKAATPQIEVSPEAAARSCIIHACGTPPEDIAATPSARPEAPAFARAVERAPGDKNPDLPDVDLGNPEILVRMRAHVGAPFELTYLGDAMTQGRLSGPRTTLSALTAADGSAREVITDRVTMFASDDGSATVTVFGHAGASPELHTTTTLKLAKSDRAVLVSTTLENTSSSPVDAVTADDAVAWDGMKPFVPGGTRASQSADAREFTGPYVGAVGGNDSLAFTSTEGEVSATLDKDSARFHLARGLSLSQRSQKTFDRVIVVGTRADSSSVVAELLHTSGLPTGVVRVNLFSRGEVDGQRPPLVSPSRPEELVVRAGGADALTVRMPSHQFDVELPEGSFTVRSKGAPESEGVAVTIHAGLVANISVPLAR